MRVGRKQRQKMANILTDEQTLLMRPWQAWLRIVFVGAGIGLLFWVLSALLAKYVIEPFTCRQIVDVAQCLNSTSLAGNVAAILAALGAILVLVRMNIAQPTVIAVVTAALLWDLSAYTTGLFWLEALAWSIILYALSYGLFAWITRYTRLIFAAIIALLITLIIRIAIIL